MPARSITFEPGSVFHIFNRGVERRRIFPRPGLYVFFLLRLRRYFRSPQASILAYCLMPNHYHLVVELDEDILADRMHRLQMSYAKAVNTELRRVGPLFQGRYHARPIRNDEDLLNLTGYVHLNPVEASLVKRPEDWPYSSYRRYIGRQEDSFVEARRVLDLMAPGQIGNSQRRLYKEFVDVARTGL